MYDNTRVLSIISKLGDFLREPLTADKTQLVTALTGLESLRFELAEVLVDWQTLLVNKKSQMLYPKDKDMTELDRRTRLNASVADIERDVEFLKSLAVIVAERLKLGSILLAVDSK